MKLCSNTTEDSNEIFSDSEVSPTITRKSTAWIVCLSAALFFFHRL